MLRLNCYSLQEVLKANTFSYKAWRLLQCQEKKVSKIKYPLMLVFLIFLARNHNYIVFKIQPNQTLSCTKSFDFQNAQVQKKN